MDSFMDFLDIITNEQPNKVQQYISKWSPIPGAEHDAEFTDTVGSALKSFDLLADQARYAYDEAAHARCFALYANYVIAYSDD